MAVKFCVAIAICLPLTLSACDDGLADSNSGEGANLVQQSQVATADQAEPAPAANDVAPPKGMERNCQFVSCSAGTTVTIKEAKGDEVYACETEPLLNYVNTVSGMMQAGARLGAGPPNLNQQTGEPEYQDSTEQMIVDARTKAGVQTFDQAMTHCAIPPNHRQATVLNYPSSQDRQNMWLHDSRSGASYWMLKAAADRSG